ncbi:hypothetical protein LIER_37847 [Lithospermum erythrorhizon]|uniref:DYW domain-containing protein n=1 Tax=Lithospermum erythrorhizon TaxID=34254 RepID=A0AAV3PUB4_LITER
MICSTSTRHVPPPKLPIESSPHPLSTSISLATSASHLKQIHAKIIRNNTPSPTPLLFNILLSSLQFNSSLQYSISFFLNLPILQPHLYNKLFLQLSRSTSPQNALLFWEIIRNKDLVIDRFGFPNLIKAAAKALALKEGMQMHCLGAKLGFDLDPFVQTSLVMLYASCGNMSDARLMFDKMSHRDIVTWNILIDGYFQCGQFDDVIDLLNDMRSSNVQPDGRMFSTILSACGRSGNLEIGKVIHEFLSDGNTPMDSHLQSALLGMYARSGSMDVAQDLYDTLTPKNIVASTTMLSGYAKIGHVEAARKIFELMIDKDLVCWSAMISGYAESDHPIEALNLFNEMQASGIKPDQVTMLSVISACANLGALDQSKRLHKLVKKSGFGNALPINNALIDMYAKCGSLEGAREVFNQMHRKNVISWTSMITACAMHGDADNALTLFRHMKAENIEPNWITFVGVLHACSHTGLVEVGEKIFASMVNEYNITPKLEHYGCMVDLYGRAKLLREALEVVETMPQAPNVIIWGSLMAACRLHGESELGEYAAKQLLLLAPDHDGAHVFLSNIYAKERKWEYVREVRRFMKHKCIDKERGLSKIEIGSKVYEFSTEDKKHERANDIYNKLDEVVSMLKDAGYAPDTRGVLLDIDEDEKENAVLWHSEKLALCWGLIGQKNRSTIRIMKNLRICQDCHNFIKLVSKEFDREIIVRDRTRFHHYRDGVCSCKDYW